MNEIDTIAGSKLKIFTYPDKILTQVAEPITEFDAALEQFTQDMIFTMYQAPGIGLAAPQVGKSLRLFVLDVDYEREFITNPEGEEEVRLSNLDPKVFINPEIIAHDGQTKYKEGCLSLPEVYEDVERFESITVSFQDVKGAHHEIEATGLLSICIQHELDHLNGIVFLDHLSSIKKSLYKKKLSKRKK